MEPVANPVIAETGTKALMAQILGNFGIHRAAQLTESLNSVFLSNFHHNARTGSHLISDRNEFGKHSAVNLKEFLRCGLVQVEHLHRRDFETFFKDGVNSLSSKASCHNMGFNNNASAVRANGSGRELFPVKEKFNLAAHALNCL